MNDGRKKTSQREVWIMILERERGGGGKREEQWMNNKKMK